MSIVGLLLLLSLVLQESQSFSLHRQPLTRARRAVFDIIPKKTPGSISGEVGLEGEEELQGPGSRCRCDDGTMDCVLDFKDRCKPLLVLAGTEPAERDEKSSNRHVKRRLTNLVMSWIRMKDAERRILEQLEN